jgi:6-phosphogluconolactonase/glucosamine-6-phosphate isomerase/deaminase
VPGNDGHTLSLFIETQNTLRCTYILTRVKQIITPNKTD